MVYFVSSKANGMEINYWIPTGSMNAAANTMMLRTVIVFGVESTIPFEQLSIIFPDEQAVVTTFAECRDGDRFLNAVYELLYPQISR